MAAARMAKRRRTRSPATRIASGSPAFGTACVSRPGCGCSGRNRFAVSPLRIAMAADHRRIGCINALCWFSRSLLFGRKIDRTEIKDDPIFVIGHWRSGTTLLHELLVLDPRHTFPDTYACFCAQPFSGVGLVHEAAVEVPACRRSGRWTTWLAGWDHPQEDEFALCNMGVPSPYLTIAFPNRPPQYQEYLDFGGLSAASVARWKRALLWFLKCITLRNPKRIVLKSPPHTCRIRTLLETVSQGEVRPHCPRSRTCIFPSTVNLWKRLYRDQGLQMPTYEGLDEHVFETFDADVRGVSSATAA